MKIIADLHIHSRFSRATSKNLNVINLYKWSLLKGINVLGTGDFTHPGWLQEIEDYCVPAKEYGLYDLKEEYSTKINEEIPNSCQETARFLLSAEISSIYKKDGKTRKVHNVVFAPDIKTAKEINKKLSSIGNLQSDGRPILGLDCKNLLEIMLEISEDIYIVPAHIWTPWFSILGAKSGFDAIEECFEDLTPYIFALETGLSSDPAMNWACSWLDRYSLISNSDAHSPGKLGREANLFDIELSYNALFDALKTKKGFLGTIEFFPEEGKYHLDGHRKCGTRLTPEETIKNKGLCPVCGKSVTVGVMHRVFELSDRKEVKKPEGAPDFSSLVGLETILSEILQVGPSSKKVAKFYHELLENIGPELEILNTIPLERLESIDPLLKESIKRVRAGEVEIKAGFDGEYGIINIFKPGEHEKYRNQATLFDMAVKTTKKQEKKK